MKLEDVRTQDWFKNVKEAIVNKSFTTDYLAKQLVNVDNAEEIHAALPYWLIMELQA